MEEDDVGAVSPRSNGAASPVAKETEAARVQGDASSKGAKLIEKEVAETGSVGWGVYAYYARNMGFVGVFVSVLAQIFCQVNTEYCVKFFILLHV